MKTKFLRYSALCLSLFQLCNLSADNEIYYSSDPLSTTSSYIPLSTSTTDYYSYPADTYPLETNYTTNYDTSDSGGTIYYYGSPGYYNYPYYWGGYYGGYSPYYYNNRHHYNRWHNRWDHGGWNRHDGYRGDRRGWSGSHRGSYGGHRGGHGGGGGRGGHGGGRGGGRR